MAAKVIVVFHLIDSSTIANLLDVTEAPENMTEKMAISAIQNELMSIETSVNPASSTMTTPPAYSTAVSTFLSIKLFVWNYLRYFLISYISESILMSDTKREITDR